MNRFILFFLSITISLLSSMAHAGTCGGVTHPNVSVNYTDYGLLGQWQAVCELDTSGTTNPIEGTLTLTNNILWVLKGIVNVGNGSFNFASPDLTPGQNGNGILNIEAGTMIVGDGSNDSLNNSGRADVLYIRPGSRLFANGTASTPITFTSIEDLTEQDVGAGQWGGVGISGYGNLLWDVISTTCVEVCTFLDPYGMNTQYGGYNPMNTSGQLTYVNIRFAGKGLPNSNREVYPSFFLGSVESETVIHHVNVHQPLSPAVRVDVGDPVVTDLVVSQEHGLQFDLTGYGSLYQIDAIDFINDDYTSHFDGSIDLQSIIAGNCDSSWVIDWTEYDGTTESLIFCASIPMFPPIAYLLLALLIAGIVFYNRGKIGNQYCT